MSEQDIIQYLSNRKFTVLWSGGKDSTATLLWVLDHIQHEKWNILYVEVTGNTHYLCNQYVHSVARLLGIHNKLIHARREDLDFFDCLEKWGVPIFGKYRWCLYQFKQRPIKQHSYTIQVTGIRRSDSVRRKNIKLVEFFRQTQSIVVHPILYWTKKQVLEYIAKHEIPLNPCYRLFRHSGNCMFCPYHSLSQIILTLQDPGWREIILETLERANQRGYISENVIARWLKYRNQSVLLSSHFSEKCGGGEDEQR